MNSKAFFGGVVVSPEADMVARELIYELHIPKPVSYTHLRAHET